LSALPVERDGVGVGRVARDDALASNCIFNYAELAEEHLVDSQAPIAPGVKVKQDSLAAFESRGTPDYAATGSDLAALFFKHDFTVGYLSLEHFLDAQADVSEYPTALLIYLAAYRSDFASDDRAGVDY